MTTRPTDEEIRGHINYFKALGYPLLVEHLEAWLTERQAARDGVTSEVVRKAYDALLADMDPIEGVSLGCMRKALEAISAEISISEVTDEMIDKAMTAYDEFFDAEDEADYEAMRTALQSVAQPVSEIVVTKNEVGQIVAVTRQYEDGRVLEVIAESTAQPVKVPDAYTVPAVSKTVTVCSCGKSWEAGSAPDCACRNTSPQPQLAVPDGLNTAAWNLFTAYLDQYLPENAKLRGHRALAWVRKNAPLQSEMSALVEELGASLSAAPAYNGKKEG